MTSLPIIFVTTAIGRFKLTGFVDDEGKVVAYTGEDLEIDEPSLNQPIIAQAAVGWLSDVEVSALRVQDPQGNTAYIPAEQVIIYDEEL